MQTSAHRAGWLALLASLASCQMVSLPPASSRRDGGPVAARGTISHEARSQVRIYRDAAGCESVQTVNRTFRLVTVRGPEGPERLVLEETSDVRECLDTGAASSETTVTAWRPDSAARIPRFQITGRGLPGEVAGNLYRMTGRACCGSGELATYFSLLSGRALFSASGPVVRLHDPASGESRFAAVHDSYSAGSPPESAADSTVVGVLQWGGDRDPARRVVVTVPRPEPFTVRGLGFARAGRPLPDSLRLEAGSGLELRFRLAAAGSGRTIDVSVPLAGLELALDRARVSGGGRLRPSP